MHALEKQCVKIFKDQPIIAGYVFGSTALKTRSPASDLDIALFLDERLSKKARFALRLDVAGRLSRALQHDADVVVLNDVASLFFKYVIISEGKVIYENDEADRADFECRLMGVYFDYQPFLEQYNENYVKTHAK
ncbi:MAG: hypothetical protein A2036_02735 [Omnitrophica bacterium GWA2_50_21]|nr:MAG: hypothetical protein A2036_02735 [Omnitrophica bacterium GWA2_50_21]